MYVIYYWKEYMEDDGSDITFEIIGIVQADTEKEALETMRLELLNGEYDFYTPYLKDKGEYLCRFNAVKVPKHRQLGFDL